MEVVESLRPPFRQRSSVTVMRIIAVVDMTVKTVRTVKPWASSDEHSAGKPIRSIIAVRSTIVGWIVEVPVRTHGSWPYVHADGNLGGRHRCTEQEGGCENYKSKRIDFEHDFSFIRSEFQAWKTGGPA
jgi:hypothetical protein